MDEKTCFLCEERIGETQSRVMHTECKYVHRKCEEAHKKSHAEIRLTVSDSASVTGYAPFKPPFKYDYMGQVILDSLGNTVVDIRGWGFLTGKGAMAYESDKAAAIQDSIGIRITQLMNIDAGA